MQSGLVPADEMQPLLQPHQVRIDKTPRLMTLRNLQEGDIVLFDKRWPGEAARDEAGAHQRHRKDITGETTVTGQSLYSEKGGHKEIIHAGFIARHDGKLKLVHLEGSGIRIQSIDEQDEIPGSFNNRTSYVHRPSHCKKNPAMKDQLAEKLSQLITEVEAAAQKGKRVKWRMRVALESMGWSIARRMKLRTRDPQKLIDPKALVLTADEISKSSICCKLIVDIYNAACARMTAADGRPYQARLMNVTGYVVPKTLQAFLYHNPNYEDFVMPVDGERVLSVIADKLAEYVMTLEQGDAAARQTSASLRRFMEDFNMREGEDIIQQTIRFLREANEVAPLPESVKFAAKRNGIYQKYYTGKIFIEPDRNIDETHQKLSTHAQLHYAFSKPIAKQYSKFRKLGFNDGAAKFECERNPTFKQWFKLNRTRKIVLSAATLGIGHLCQYFYFLGVAHKIKKRNAALQAEADAPRMVM